MADPVVQEVDASEFTEVGGCPPILRRFQRSTIEKMIEATWFSENSAPAEKINRRTTITVDVDLGKGTTEKVSENVCPLEFALVLEGKAWITRKEYGWDDDEEEDEPSALIYDFDGFPDAEMVAKQLVGITPEQNIRGNGVYGDSFDVITSEAEEFIEQWDSGVLSPDEFKKCLLEAPP